MILDQISNRNPDKTSGELPLFPKQGGFNEIFEFQLRLIFLMKFVKNLSGGCSNFLGGGGTVLFIFKEFPLPCGIFRIEIRFGPF